MDTMRSDTNPWMVATVGLLGLIMGYGIASVQTSWTKPTTGTVVVQNPGTNPTAPTPPAAPEQPAPEKAGPVPEITSADHVRGNPNAAVTIVEYSDFECPFCQRHHATMKQLVETYKDDVNWVYRHFPLSFHPKAQKQAEAAECATKLGGAQAFWTYHDAMMEGGSTGRDFSVPGLVALAKEQGLSSAKFEECLNSNEFAPLVSAQMAGGSTAGVSGTPGNIVINNKTKETQLVSGAYPFSHFQTIIDGMLATN